MSYQAILAVVTGRDGDKAVLEAANIIARHFQSHIDVCFFGELPHPIPCLQASVAPNFVADIVKDADANVRLKRDAAHKTFRLWMSRASLCARDYSDNGDASPLLTASWLEWAGSHDQLGVQGRYADIVIMEKPPSSAATKSGLLLGGDIQCALFESARPVLFVPADWTAFPTLDSWVTLVAWNGSAEAARAVGYGLPILSSARSVKVFCGMEAEKPSIGLSRAVDRFRRYLSLQAIHAAIREAEINSTDAGKSILAEAVACDAQLIVLGAFTHSRMREIVLGGATEHVLSHSHVPVLMAH